MSTENNNPLGKLENTKHREIITIILIISLSFLIRVGWMEHRHNYREVKDYENGEIARNLISGEGFSMVHTGSSSIVPTAHKPPFYPFFLAFVFKFFPQNPYFVIELIQALILSLSAVIIYLIAKRTYNSSTIGILSAGFMCLSPFVLSTHIRVENMSFAIFFLSLLILSLLELADKPTLKNSICSGFLFGLSTLNLAATLSFLPFSIIWLYWYVKKNISSFGKRIIMLLVVLLAFTATILPWTVRNYFVFHKLVPISSTFPYQVYVSNNPSSTGGMFNEEGKAVTGIPDELLAATKGMNEVEQYSYFGKYGWAFIKQFPLQFIKLRFKALFYFWFGEAWWRKVFLTPKFEIYKILTIFMLGISVIGISLSWRKYLRETLLLVFLFTAFSLLHSFTHGDIGFRYRLPLDPFLLIFSSVAFVSLFKWALAKYKFTD